MYVSVHVVRRAYGILVQPGEEYKDMRNDATFLSVILGGKTGPHAMNTQNIRKESADRGKEKTCKQQLVDTFSCKTSRDTSRQRKFCKLEAQW